MRMAGRKSLSHADVIRFAAGGHSGGSYDRRTAYNNLCGNRILFSTEYGKMMAKLEYEVKRIDTTRTSLEIIFALLAMLFPFYDVHLVRLSAYCCI